MNTLLIILILVAFVPLNMVAAFAGYRLGQWLARRFR